MLKTTVTVGKKVVYVNPEKKTVKIGSKSAASPLNTILAPMPKGERRKVRKALRSSGYAGLMVG